MGKQKPQKIFFMLGGVLVKIWLETHQNIYEKQIVNDCMCECTIFFFSINLQTKTIADDLPLLCVDYYYYSTSATTTTLHQ